MTAVPLLVLVALSANLLVGRSHRAVRPGIADHLRRGAQIVTFQEAGGYLPVIRNLAAAHGYRAPIVAPRSAGPGMDSSVLLVGCDVPMHASGVALVRAPWTGPRLKIRWPGRGIPWAVVDLDLSMGAGAGMICRTLAASVHGPTGRDRANTRAWRRYLRRLRRLTRRLARTHGATHVLLTGDWNCPAAATDRLSVRRLLADRIDARIVKTGTSIDYAVTDLPLVGQKGPKHGSDHPSVRFTRKAPR